MSRASAGSPALASLTAALRSRVSRAASIAARQASASVLSSVIGKGGEKAVAEKLQHLAAPRGDRRCHGLEVFVQACDEAGARSVGDRREAAQVGDQESGAKRLAGPAPDLAVQHAPPRREADIGVEHAEGQVEQGHPVGRQGEQRHEPVDARDL